MHKRNEVNRVNWYLFRSLQSPTLSRPKPWPGTYVICGSFIPNYPLSLPTNSSTLPPHSNTEGKRRVLLGQVPQHDVYNNKQIPLTTLTVTRSLTVLMRRNPVSTTDQTRLVYLLLCDPWFQGLLISQSHLFVPCRVPPCESFHRSLLVPVENPLLQIFLLSPTRATECGH